MYNIDFSNKYHKDHALSIKRGYDMSLLDTVVFQLANNNVLDAKHRNHRLSGNYAGCFECHVKPDWLLIYQKDDENQLLLLLRTGTHSDLF